MRNRLFGLRRIYHAPAKKYGHLVNICYRSQPVCNLQSEKWDCTKSFLWQIRNIIQSLLEIYRNTSRHIFQVGQHELRENRVMCDLTHIP